MRFGVLHVAALALLGAAMPQAGAQAPQPKTQVQQEMKAVRPDAAKTIKPSPFSGAIVYRVSRVRDLPTPVQIPLVCSQVANDGVITQAELAQFNQYNCAAYYSVVTP